MRKLVLEEKEHDISIGDTARVVEPNVHEDCLLMAGGAAVGFYIKNLPEKAAKLARIANNEFNSARVPKSTMVRSAAVMKGYSEDGARGTDGIVEQYSTIIGSVPPRPHMKRDYANISSVHRDPGAKLFIKAMYLLAMEAEKIIAATAPGIYEAHKKGMGPIKKKWRFTDFYTSSISNYNIAAGYHKDTGNVVNSVNTIITRRENSEGGSLHVPDYGLCFEQGDNSMLVYPAWRNMHGVTPIKRLAKNGYRNSLVFYSLKTFSR